MESLSISVGNFNYKENETLEYFQKQFRQTIFVVSIVMESFHRGEWKQSLGVQAMAKFGRIICNCT